MFQEFLEHYLNTAKYEPIDKGRTYYGEVPQLKGVWAIGETLEQCRRNLAETIEGWAVLRLKKDLPIPNFQISFKKMSLPEIYALT